MGRLVAVELFKLHKRLLARVLVGLLLLVTIGVQVGQWQSLQATSEAFEGTSQPVIIVGPGEGIKTRPEQREPSVTDDGDGGRLSEERDRALRETFLQDGAPDLLGLLRGVGLVLGALLVAGSIGSEYTWGTLRPVLTCVPSRERYIASKLLALGIALVAALATAVVAGLVSRVIITAIEGGVELGFLDGGYALDAFFDFGRLVATLVPYLLIVALATAVTRSAMVGVGGGLIVIVIDAVLSEVLARQPTWVRHIPEYLLQKNANAVLGVGEETVRTVSDQGVVAETVVEGLRDPWAGALVLAAYAGASLVVIFAVFRRRDVTA